jgi:hypothetical protein
MSKLDGRILQSIAWRTTHPDNRNGTPIERGEERSALREKIERGERGASKKRTVRLR